MIQRERIHGSVKDETLQDGDHVLYWMQDAVRTEYNHALEYAVDCANTLRKPLLVIFVIADAFPEANLRHYSFLIDGLVDVERLLEDRGIRLQVFLGNPVTIIPKAAESACLLITDRGYLRIQNQWRESVWEGVSCQKVSIETGVIVPVATASPKMEWSAGTFRPKISRLLPEYLKPLHPRKSIHPSLGWDSGDVSLSDPGTLLSRLLIDTSVSPTPLQGGELSAKSQISWFVNERLHRYDVDRNDPNARATSRISPYLHFGQISPLSVALSVIAAKNPGSAPFLEQLIVRRELACNFLHYNQGYDQYSPAIPDWAQRTLTLHAGDARPYVYTCEEFETANTHDPYWNAMQTELVLTGYLHGHLRMYWGKKILEWSENPEIAYQTALYLNNRYQLDGRDANGYTGVAWCFGRHDRPWKERPIFGMVRYMNDAGLKRKFKVEAYRERIEIMAAELAKEAV